MILESLEIVGNKLTMPRSTKKAGMNLLADEQARETTISKRARPKHGLPGSLEIVVNK